MKIRDNSTSVLILGCKIGALAIMRSLGSQGIPVHGVDDSAKSPALHSRYLKKKFILEFDENNPDDYLDYILAIGVELERPAILIPTSDELSIFVAENINYLRPYFSLPIW